MIDLIQFSAFHFIRPWWLVLIVPLVLTWFFAKPEATPDTRWKSFLADHLVNALLIKGGHDHRLNPINMGAILFLLCTLLMAGPSWQRQASPFVQDTAVLVIALDLSDTMSQQDIQPSRFERAKQKIIDLIELRGDARTGLIAYAGSAHQVIPLSNDPRLIEQFLASVDSSMMQKSGKFPETILPLAKRMLGDARGPGTLLLIGDGVAPATEEKFGAMFADQTHQFIVLGMGSTEVIANSEVDQRFGGAHLALQENALKSLASNADGYYQRNTVDKKDVLRINRLIEYHLASVDDDDRPWKDAGYFLLYPISLIFLLWFRRGWTLNWCIAIFLVNVIAVPPPSFANEVELSSPGFANVSLSKDVSSNPNIDRGVELSDGKLQTETSALNRLKREFMSLWMSPDQQGRYYFERGDYVIAAQRFENLAWQGIAYYYAENFKASAELFRRIDSREGRFNLANALAQSQNYVAAIRAYSRVLEVSPDHAGALKNRDLVQQIVDDINRMSASQQTEQGQATRELGDAPQRGDGAMQDDIAAEKEEQLTAQQLLADEDIHEMWMRQVQADPTRFLRAKFQLQYSQQKDNSNSHAVEKK